MKKHSFIWTDPVISYITGNILKYGRRNSEYIADLERQLIELNTYFSLSMSCSWILDILAISEAW